MHRWPGNLPGSRARRRSGRAWRRSSADASARRWGYPGASQVRIGRFSEQHFLAPTRASGCTQGALRELSILLHGLTVADVKGWMPPAVVRRGRQRAV